MGSFFDTARNWVNYTGGDKHPWTTGLSTAAVGVPLGIMGMHLFGRAMGADESTDKRRWVAGALLGGLSGYGVGNLLAQPQYRANQATPYIDTNKSNTYFDSTSNPSETKFAQVSANAAVESVLLDNSLTPQQKLEALSFFSEADPGHDLKGLISKRNLIEAAVGAGLGWTGGQAVGGALDLLLGEPGRTRRFLSRAGALGGLLINTGIVQ